MISFVSRFAAPALLSGAIAILSGGVMAAPAAPKVDAQLTSAPAAPYDVNADAHAEVAAAISRAAQSHKFVLIDFGGNWCPDCRITAGVLAMDQVKPWIAAMFEVVMVDVGRMNKNMDIAAQYGVHVKAVPTMIVLDPAGKMLNGGSDPAALQDARGMTPQAIVDTLNGWIQKPG
jgi:thiol-disulfide isomerase/thioredoxin